MSWHLWCPFIINHESISKERPPNTGFYIAKRLRVFVQSNLAIGQKKKNLSVISVNSSAAGGEKKITHSSKMSNNLQKLPVKNTNGSIDLIDVLSVGTPERVREEVLENFGVLGRGGGFIVGPGHTYIQPDVPLENILEMYRVAYEECDYA